MGFLMGRIRADHFSNKTLATVFVYTTFHGVHLQQGARMMNLRFFGLSKRNHQNCDRQMTEFHEISFRLAQLYKPPLDTRILSESLTKRYISRVHGPP